MRRLALLLACLFLGAAGATAAPGDHAERAFRLGATLVPLPQGRWVVAAEAGELDGKISAVVLAQIEDKTLRGLVIARSNREPTQVIFGTTAECDRSDSYLAYTSYDTPQDGLCGYANLVVAGEGEAPVWAAAKAFLAGRGVDPGRSWLMAGFRARVRPALLDVRYYVPPPRSGDATGWAASEWSPARISDSPERAAAVDQLRLWAAWMRDPVAMGVRGRLDGVELPPLPSVQADILPALVAARVRTLDALRESGAIAPDEYARQRELLEKVQAAPDRAEMPLWARSAWKTLTYRVASIVDALAVSYAVLGSVTQTIGFSVIGEFIRPPAVYVHEMLWARSGIGRAAAPGKPQEFAEIGVNK